MASPLNCEPSGTRPDVNKLKNTIMTNVEIKKSGTILTITVDLSKNSGPSKSGKSIVIASTLGNALVDPEKKVYMGLNVYSTR